MGPSKRMRILFYQQQRLEQYCAADGALDLLICFG